MSPLFIKLVKDETKCSYCKASPKEGYICCERHLQIAKLRFRKWSKERKAQGLCCYCNHKSINGWLRCKSHVKKNKIKCKKWYHVHKEERRNYSKNRKLRFLSENRCFSCCEHTSLTGEFKRRESCRQKFYLYTHGVKGLRGLSPENIAALYAKAKIMTTYFIIKPSNISLEEAYRLLNMKKWYNTVEEAEKDLKEADPDIIPRDSQIYMVKEDAYETIAGLRASINMTLVKHDPSYSL